MIHSYSEQVSAIKQMMDRLTRTINKHPQPTEVNPHYLYEVLNDAVSTIAALNLSDPYKEIERLTEWQNSMLKLWMPVIDWMQTKSNLGLGMDISVEVLKRVQEYESMKEKIAELEYEKKYIENLDKLKEEIIKHYSGVNGTHKIKFWHGGGFSGEMYIMQIDDKYYELCKNFGGVNGDEEARGLAIKKLKELNIEFKGKIEFEFNGSL